VARHSDTSPAVSLPIVCGSSATNARANPSCRDPWEGDNRRARATSLATPLPRSFAGTPRPASASRRVSSNATVSRAWAAAHTFFTDSNTVIRPRFSPSTVAGARAASHRVKPSTTARAGPVKSSVTGVDSVVGPVVGSVVGSVGTGVGVASLPLVPVPSYMCSSLLPPTPIPQPFFRWYCNEKCPQGVWIPQRQGTCGKVVREGRYASMEGEDTDAVALSWDTSVSRSMVAE